MNGYGSVLIIGSPFEIVEPQLTLTIGIGLGLLGVLVLFLSVMPISDRVSPRILAILGGTVVAMIMGSGVMRMPQLRTAWTILAVVYAILIPVLVTVVGVRGLVTSRSLKGDG